VVCLLKSNGLNQADAVWAVHDPKAKWRLLDDFIRECEHRGRDVEAKSLGSRERR